jgi:transcriptional regulator with XRE-family HTH domain
MTMDGRKLRLLRRRRRLSLREVQAASGVDPSQLSKIERDLWPASQDVLQRLANVYGEQIVIRIAPQRQGARAGAERSM